MFVSAGRAVGGGGFREEVTPDAEADGCRSVPQASRGLARTAGFTEHTNDTKITRLVCETQTPGLLTAFLAKRGPLRTLPADPRPDTRTLTHPSSSHSVV